MVLKGIRGGIKKLLLGSSKTRVKRPPRDAITAQDYKRLMEFLPQTSVKLRLIFFLLYYCGLRVDEVRHLSGRQLSELASSTGTVLLKTKNRQHRLIVLPKEQRSVFKNLLQGFDTKADRIMTHKGVLYSRVHFNRMVNQAIKRFCAATGDKRNLKSHSFRIGVVTDLIARVDNIDKVRRFIGHSNISTTLRYSRYNSTAEEHTELSELRFIRKKKKIGV